jgi:hypothetical protein
LVKFEQNLKALVKFEENLKALVKFEENLKALVKFEENLALINSLFTFLEIGALHFALASSSDLFRVLDDPVGE